MRHAAIRHLPHPPARCRALTASLVGAGVALFAVLALFGIQTARGADGTWNIITGGDWDQITNWKTSTVATGSGATAYFNVVDITGDVTVQLNGNRTIGNIVFGDTNTATAGSWILSDGGDAKVLTLAGTTPTITVNALGTNKIANISASIAGTAGLTKAGDGTLQLSKGKTSNTYTGTTTINAGILRISDANALGNTANTTIVNAGGELELSGGITVGTVRSGQYALTLHGGELCNISGTDTYNGAITLTANSILDSDAGTLTVNGVIGGSSYGLTKLGTGTVALSGTNTYGGGTIINAGTLTASGTSALGATTGTLAVNNINTGVGTVGTAVVLNLSTTAATTTGSLSGTIATPASGTNTATINNGGHLLTVNQTTADTYAGVIAGNGGFTLGSSSTNALTLTGTNTYSGITTVSGGKLTIASTGTINGTSEVQIGAGEFSYNSSTALSKNITFSGTGGILSGTGTITNAVTVANGNTHAPGAVGTAGTQAFSNNLTYASGSIFAWDLTTESTTTGFDKVTGASDKTFAAAGAFHVVTNLDFSTTFWDVPKQWSTIFSDFSTLTGWGANTAVEVYNTSGTLRTDVASQGAFTVSGTTLTWNYATVPEPSTALAGILLGAGLLRRRR